MNVQVVECLSGSLSVDPNTRMVAELRVSQLLPLPETALALSSILLSQDLDASIRQISLANIILRKYVNERWSPYFPGFKGNAPRPEVKSQVRQAVFQGLSDPNSKIRSSCAHTLSTIANSDWPDEYPDLLNSLIALISSSSPNAVHGAMQVFTEFVKSDLSEDQILPVLRDLLPVLLSILGSKTYTPLTRARTISVFQQCVSALFMVKDQHPEAVKEAIGTVLPVWLEAFKVLLSHDPMQEIQEANNWDSLVIRTQIFKTLDTIYAFFPKAIRPDVPGFLDLALSHLQAIFPLFGQYYLIQASPALPGSSEDEAVELPQFGCPIIDCITAFIRRGRVKDWYTVENASRLLSTVLVWIQMTNDDEENCANDANAFLQQEDDESQAYSLRIAGLDLFSCLMDTDPSVTVRAFQQTISHTLEQSRHAKDAGNSDWWRPVESAFGALGSVAEDVLDFIDDEQASERSCPIDFHSLLSNVIPAFLPLADCPFLQGRSLVFASRYARLVPRELAGQYLTSAVDIIEAAEASIPIKVSAVKAIQNFSLGLDDAMIKPLAPRIAQDIGPFMQHTSEDSLTLVMDTLASVITIDKGSWLDPDLAQALVAAVLDVWMKNNKDPIFISILTDILNSLASAPGPGVYQSVVEKSLPTLSDAIAVAKLEESWIASTAIELVTSLISGAPEAGLGNGFFAAVAPSLFKCMELAEDRDVLQNGVTCLTWVIRRDCPQLLSWKDQSGVSGIDNVLSIVAKLLNNEDESGGLVIGDLILRLLRKASHAVIPVLPGLLQAMVRRMITAKTATFVQSLIMPCAFLVQSERDTMLPLLEAMNIDGRSGLNILIHTWCENAETFQGFWPSRVSTLGLCQLLASERPSIQNTMVKGDLIVKPETQDVIVTRSKSKQMPHEFTSVSFPVKALKILIHDLQSNTGESGMMPSGSNLDADSDDDDDDWADEDKYAGTGADKDLALLSDMFGPKGSAYANEDLFDNEDEDEDLKNDPITQMDMKACLISFFRECTARNMSNFTHLVDQLSAEETVVLRQALHE